MVRKGTDRGRCTHCLKIAEGGTCQDRARTRASKAHLLTEEGRWRDLSEHGKNATEQGALTAWRQQREGFVRTGKEKDRARRTHYLETADGGTCQDTERNRPSKAHSQTGDGRGTDLSGHRK